MEQYFLLKLSLAEKYKEEENWTEAERKLIQDHFIFLQQLGKDGTLILAGRTDYELNHDDLIGIALIKAASLEFATHLLMQDPAVKAGIQLATIHPFKMAIEQFENKLI
mgnify:CR=1 FL=1|jgi:uncharacterized protein YciI